MSRSAKILLSLSLLFLIASGALGIALSEYTLHVNHRPIRHRDEFATVVRDQFHAELQNASITAADGATLRGWFVQPEHDNHSTIILLHGVTDNREGVAGYSRMFLNRGYRVVLPDSRAHGQSGGAIATYGLLERDDVHRWAEWSRAKPDSGCVYLFGESMGAAIALQATASDQRLCGVVVESPYSTFREVAYDRFARHGHLPLWLTRIVGEPTLDFALLYTRLRYKIDLRQSSPEYFVGDNRVPLLLIAGTADHNIPARHSHILMQVAKSRAELWVVPGADHGGAVVVAPQEFWTRILNFYAAHTSHIFPD